ncbi:MAG TPA: 3-deoxy-D-manno-octulosonic acid transferase, partial [Candidatus Polarisedimenticolia bacterium]
DRLYGALIRLAWAAVIPYQVVIALLRGRRHPLRLEERLGRPRQILSGGIWVHAVSVGEVRLALSLVARLKESAPGLPIHLTTGTETGRTLAMTSAGAAGGPDSVSAFPFDLPGPMGRLLDRLQPRLVLILETELWPNLFTLCGRRGIPVALANGRISARAYPRYLAVRPFFASALRAVRLFSMQSEEDADRARRLGAPAGLVRVTGNLKYDLPLPSLDADEARRRLALPRDLLLFVAGSTAPGEEAPILEAFTALRVERSSSRLAIVPRHPEDLRRTEDALRSRGLRVRRYSRLGVETGPPDPGYDALLVDVMGVLPEVYAAADLVFVGGSLVSRGGQNLLEPAALGKPVLFGPRTQNFRAAATSLLQAGAGFVARDGRELGRLLVRLARNPDAARLAGERGRLVVEANRGALDRTVALLQPLLDHPSRDGAGIPAIAPGAPA